MPVEIKELIIRAVVESGAGTGGSTRDQPPPSEEKSALVQACVKEVLRILRKSQER